MLRHIVMIKLNNESNTVEVINKLKTMLNSLEKSIDSLHRMEVGINISKKPSAFDLVLTADFEDENGLDEYRVHPSHVLVLNYLKIVMEKAAVVDYIN